MSDDYDARVILHVILTGEQTKALEEIVENEIDKAAKDVADSMRGTARDQNIARLVLLNVISQEIRHAMNRHANGEDRPIADHLERLAKKERK